MERLDNPHFMKMMDGVKKGDTHTTNQFILESFTVARRFVDKIVKEYNIELDELDKESAAVDAVAVVHERLTRFLTIDRSYTAYLYLQVKHELVTKTGSRKLEEYCIKHGINFFVLTQEEKELLKEKINGKRHTDDDDNVPGTDDVSACGGNST